MLRKLIFLFPLQSERVKYLFLGNGGIAQLARALAWHARGRGFESHYLHQLY